MNGQLKRIDYLSYRGKFEEWPYTWVQFYNVPLATPLIRHQPFTIRDADFVARAMMMDSSTQLADFAPLGPFTGARFQVQISRPNELYLESKFITCGLGRLSAPALDALGNGTAMYPQPFIPEIYLQRDTTAYIDLQNVDASDLAVAIAMQGVKLFPYHSHYRPEPGTYDIERFTYRVQIQKITGLTAGVTTQVTKPLDSDSNFVLLSIDVGNLQGLLLQVYGPQNEPLSNLLTPMSCMCGTARFPGALCAPVFYPPNGAINFNIHVPATVVVANLQNPSYITFRGMKMYKVS